MPKEILIYSSIYSFTAESFIEKMEEARGEDIVLRLNTPGGDVQAGFGMIAKFAEHEGLKSIKVDGKANSMGAFFLAYADNVEALDVSEIILHRAAYPSYIESREDFKGSDMALSLDKINKDVRAGLESKIDVEAFEKVAKVSLDEMFSMDSRINVRLTPAQAKKIGLINKVKKLTSQMNTEIQANKISIAASFGVDVEALEVLPEAEENKELKPKNKNKMTLQELKDKHPEVYAQVVAVGVANEKDRVQAWMAFVDVDAKAVSEGIEAGTSMSQKAMAEFSKKMFSKEHIIAAEAENAPETETDTPLTKEQAEAKKIAEFEAEVDNNKND